MAVVYIGEQPLIVGEIEDLPEAEKQPGCTCSDEIEIHPCPYQSDINNNNEDWCYCCPECERQCARDI